MIVRRLARPLFASLFVVQGIDAARNPKSKVAAASPLLDRIGPMLGLPDDKEVLIQVNGVTQAIGGLMIATGRLPRVGGLLIAGSLVPTTLAGHAFWEKTDPGERTMHRIQFLKNLSLFGGALLAAVDTEAKPGLVWRAQHLTRTTRREARHATRAAGREARLLAHKAQDVVS